MKEMHETLSLQELWILKRTGHLPWLPQRLKITSFADDTKNDIVDLKLEYLNPVEFVNRTFEISIDAGAEPDGTNEVPCYITFSDDYDEFYYGIPRDDFDLDDELDEDEDYKEV